MAAVMSPTLDTTTSSPATSPSPISSPSSNPNHPQLPPLITSPATRRSVLQRPNSQAARNRLSQYSNYSAPSRSRPPSHIFPIFHTSLPYTLVRDFAFPISHPMHYGPPPESSQPASGASTPISESQKQLSDPPTSWDSGGGWAPGPWTVDGLFKGEQLAPIHFGDGPPWSEDEDLQSPVVVSSRHRKHKSSSAVGNGQGRGRSRNRGDGARTASMLSQENYENDRGYFVGTRGDGAERYYVNQGEEANGPGGEIVTYPAEQARHSTLAPYNVPGQRDSHFAGTLPSRSYTDETGQDYPSESDASSSESSPGMTRHDESRYSRDYQFTIASPDEEMHGKAVALFDFQRENENELPLVEGQVIVVSYRHGQGWLVAMDPRTQESGLVPEEYVRLLRDIQGGLNSLKGQANDQMLSPVVDSGTPTQAQHNQSFGNAPVTSNGNNEYQQPIVSTFSTSSRDLHPYPQHLLGTQAGQAPPQVIHYHGQRGGSQANTPTLSSSLEGSRDRPASQEAKVKKTEDSSNTTPIAVTLPDAKLKPSIAVQQPESPDSDSSEDSSDEEKAIHSP
ncbi:NAP1-binding protein 2 [Lachnellula cervina]|uniref:NAP1-binding protein 2 n=1 Tax=Lachnellula cervina TaxID=1316786 RepID=A0A7D8UL03_9HELO|nr:NAP1-binding protein 2 [Lachnellula cervina]